MKYLRLSGVVVVLPYFKLVYFERFQVGQNPGYTLFSDTSILTELGKLSLHPARYRFLR
jgi:hypothetical protein